MDAAKWPAGKIRPKAYGACIQQDVTTTPTLEDHWRALTRGAEARRSNTNSAEVAFARTQPL